LEAEVAAPTGADRDLEKCRQLFEKHRQFVRLAGTAATAAAAAPTVEAHSGPRDFLVSEHTPEDPPGPPSKHLRRIISKENVSKCEVDHISLSLQMP
jgi:hypothetical protein